ncbi:MAG: hypothetical protein AAFU03_17435, partial [Bacteroidota bacterium]
TKRVIFNDDRFVTAWLSGSRNPNTLLEGEAVSINWFFVIDLLLIRKISYLKLVVRISNIDKSAKLSIISLFRTRFNEELVIVYRFGYLDFCTRAIHFCTY